MLTEFSVALGITLFVLSSNTLKEMFQQSKLVSSSGSKFDL